MHCYFSRRAKARLLLCCRRCSSSHCRFTQEQLGWLCWCHAARVTIVIVMTRVHISPELTPWSVPARSPWHLSCTFPSLLNLTCFRSELIHSPNHGCCRGTDNMCVAVTVTEMFRFVFCPILKLTLWVSILRTACGPGRSATSRPSLPLSPCSSRCQCDKDPPHHPHALLLPPSDPLTLPH